MQLGTFGGPEFLVSGPGLFHQGKNGLPLFGVELLLGGGHHVRHAEHHGQQVRAAFRGDRIGHLAQFIIIGFDHLGIEGGPLVDLRSFGAHVKIGLAAHHALPGPLPQFRFLFAPSSGQLHLQVQLLAVERPQFNGHLLLIH